jgi:hypothetical protein
LGNGNDRQYPLSTREREREESRILPNTWKKMASQGSPGWNRIEEWLFKIESLKISLEAYESMDPSSMPCGVYQTRDV